MFKNKLCLLILIIIIGTYYPSKIEGNVLENLSSGSFFNFYLYLSACVWCIFLVFHVLRNRLRINVETLFVLYLII